MSDTLRHTREISLYADPNSRLQSEATRKQVREGIMPVAYSHVSVSEQLKSVRLVLSLIDQPLVTTAVEQWVEQRHRKPNGGPPAVNPAPVETSLARAADAALSSLTSDFTNSDLQSRIEQSGYRFRTKNPRDTLGHLLKRLVKRGRVKLVRKGSGFNPNVFRVIAS
jgi:hypothetical protein